MTHFLLFFFPTGELVRISYLVLLFAILPFFSASQSSDKTTLTVAMLIFSPEQREVLEELSLTFEQRHPNTKVRYIALDDANFKKYANDWLTESSEVDVLNWLWRYRMLEAAQKGTIEPISELWQKSQVKEQYDARFKEMVTVNGQQYAIPYSSTFWGFYYRTSLFEKLGLTSPKSWQDFIGVCRVLKKNNITPVATSSKNPWPLAAWFDYLNLRLNGLKFHLNLLAGKESFISPKVRNVFNHWTELIEQGCVTKDPYNYTFSSSVSLLYRHHAAMILAGSYLWSRTAEKVRDDLSFFPFPAINPSVASYEEVPTDLLLIPKSSQNKQAAKAFLSFFMEPKTQEIYNQKIQFLPVNKGAKIEYSAILQQGKKLIVEAKGTSQYLDRDTSYDFSNAIYKEFTEYINNGKELELVLTELEKARKRIFVE